MELGDLVFEFLIQFLFTGRDPAPYIRSICRRVSVLEFYVAMLPPVRVSLLDSARVSGLRTSSM